MIFFVNGGLMGLEKGEMRFESCMGLLLVR